MGWGVGGFQQAATSERANVCLVCGVGGGQVQVLQVPVGWGWVGGGWGE